jgi:tRNA(Ile)-lysidine synthase TilS/MesJ
MSSLPESVQNEIQQMLNDLECDILPPLLETDFTRQHIKEYFHCGDTAARRRAKEMVDSGKWILVWKRPQGSAKIATYQRKDV